MLRTKLSRLHTSFFKQSLQSRAFGVRHKVVELQDAVNIVRDGDTLVVSGFVAQGAPEALLRALGERYVKTQEPKNLRLLFGGGPGDWATRGVNHLAHPGMIETAIGAHYGQVPMMAKLVLQNEFAGYAIPMGAVSRIVRAAAGRSPGYITKVGLSTFVDPLLKGGALNEKACKSPIVERIKLDGQDYLRYFPIPINVAFIRATTADTDGNCTQERESLLGDAKIMAMAAKSSGGIVIVQVERLAETGTIPSRHVTIPGTFVDCVVVNEIESEHHLSYFTKHNPVWTGQIREPSDNIPTMELSPRKIIARRAALELKTDDVVNLGIGIPEGVASIASEEGIFQYLTLTTEAGTIGGIGAGGHDFGPATNPQAFNEMNQQFDLYNGGGLTVAFLGLAECGGKGDVNVSRLSAEKLTGPGGFIDIASCTHRVNFLGTFTKKNCKLALEKCKKTGKNQLVIKNEGQFKTFQNAVREVTFSAQEANRSGQHVLYITERAVFELGPNGIILKEIAPGINLQRDILDQMDVVPQYEEPIPLMDPRIFEEQSMGLYQDMFDLFKLLESRLTYEVQENVAMLNLQNFVIVKENDITDLFEFMTKKLKKYMQLNGGKKVNMLVNYDGFDCKSNLVPKWTEMAQTLQTRYYKSIQRFGGKVFMRKKIMTELKCENDDEFWKELTDGAEILTRKQLVALMKTKLFLPESQELVNYLMNGKVEIHREDFGPLMKKLRAYQVTKRIPKLVEGAGK